MLICGVVLVEATKLKCDDFFFTHVFFHCVILMGFVFGLAVTAVLGLLLSLLMIHQAGR
ncbi:uncharacterized protein ACO6RY_14579 [Pungitius sinensis]